MNAPTAPAERRPTLLADAATETSSALQAAVREACARIAPAWPLDRMIAVNPFWGFIGESIETTARSVATLHGAHMTMSNEWYRARWKAGAFSERDARRAMGEEAWSRMPVGDVMEQLLAGTASATRITLVTDVVDAARIATRGITWTEFAVDHISRSCAAYLDQGQATWRPHGDEGLFRTWRRTAARDRAPEMMLGRAGFRAGIAALPDNPWDLIAAALAELEVSERDRAMYCTALLMSVNGWASACAYRRWTAALESRTDDVIIDLLAIRLSWELLLLRASAPSVVVAWRTAKTAWRASESGDVSGRRSWHLQRALEFGYQLPLARQLSNAVKQKASPTVTPPQSQLVFCIDVRSEPFRRALEGVASDVRTLGFAGFFGAPIAYRSVAGITRPQLPGLLASSLVVEDVGDDRARAGAMRTLDNAQLRTTAVLSGFAATGFPYVEMTGILAVPKLLRSALGNPANAGDPARGGADGVSHTGLKPRISGDAHGHALDDEARIALAAGMLRGMSLTGDFAPLVVLVGHTSDSSNNPQATSLACGACGGQSGEVNARVMAALLNEPVVRTGLRARGIDVPLTTHVTAAVHNTTTDEVTLYDADDVPASHAERWRELATQLRRAGDAARRRRAPSLRLSASTAEALRTAFMQRAKDWSEVRPEWGLARNAAFIVAPRARTAGIDLGGRAFLHEYRPERDIGYAVLESIMTAPMLVTHWINMQYYASTVDNRRYGSGDKTLHNVVGASLGVLEGASGDLRTGLALQSVHDGDDWYHEPLRLSVFIEAPADAIDDIIARHAVVHQLVEGEWLHLFRMDPASGAVFMRTRTEWQSTEAVL